MVAVSGSPCLVNSCRMSHFGMKPVKGGSPPRDSSSRGTRAVRTGTFDHEVAKELMVVALFSLKVRNVAEVIVIYKSRDKRVKEGANCITRIIHPRWAMEE